MEEARKKKLKVDKMYQGLHREGKRQEHRYANLMMRLENQLEGLKQEMRNKKEFEDEIIQMLTL